MLFLAIAALLSAALGGVAQSDAQSQPRRQPPDIQGEQGALPDKDVRPGRAAPTQLQRTQVGDATVIWNELGTPATLTDQGAPLATGLPADPATRLGATFRMVPGEYSFVAVGAGFGHKRLSADIGPGTRTLTASLSRNHAAAANGAMASGDGVNQAMLVDETEATNWASLTAPVADRQVTVDLAGDAPVTVRRVQVSAMLRPDVQDPADPGGRTGSALSGSSGCWPAMPRREPIARMPSRTGRSSPAPATPSRRMRRGRPRLI